MSIGDRSLGRWGRGLAGFAVIGALVGMMAAPFVDADILLLDFAAHQGVLAVGLGAVAWASIARQPRNGALWVMVGSAFFGALYVLGDVSAVLIARQSIPGFSIANLGHLSPSDVPTVAIVIAQPSLWGWVPTLFGVLTLGLLLFPDGRAPSPPWRWLGWYSAAGMLVTAVSLGWLYRPSSTLGFDAAEEDYPGIVGALFNIGLLMLLSAAVASIVAVVLRYRRSSGVTRRQIRWIGLGGASITLTILLSFALGTNDSALLEASLILGGEALFIASFVVALTKYRLYDVDLVISKTVTYASLAIVITGLYAGGVFGYIALFGDPSQRAGEGLGTALPLGAAAVVVLIFEPIRRRLQRWANRVVYGERAAPYEVLSQLTRRLSDSRAGSELAGIADLLREGTGAEAAVVWLRVGNRLRPEAVSPGADEIGDRQVDDVDDLPHSEHELAVPVTHSGEVLGALAISKPRSYPVTPADGELLTDVAAGVGLMLRNLRLNAELAERARELRESRRRLIAAQDAVRHRLERDLHDGAQQQVVALKVKLGLARTIAEREGAERIAGMVQGLAAETDDAVDGMRRVARGIYPPLLESEGLGAALAAVPRHADAAVVVRTQGLGRYERSLEETAYFCVLSAVQQAVMAGAGSVEVRVSEADGALSIELTYDAVDRDHDMTAITDRVDAFAGDVESMTRDGSTELAIRLPLSVAEGAALA